VYKGGKSEKWGDPSGGVALKGEAKLRQGLQSWKKVKWTGMRCCKKFVSQWNIGLGFYFSSTRVWIQSFEFARQALYHLSYAFSSFCCDYFGDRVSLFIQAGLYSNPPVLPFLSLLGWQASTTRPSFFPLRWNLTNFFSRLASNHDPPDLNLPSSYRL
jgi:hypothetical protein